MKTNMTMLETIACFLNGAHIVWRQRVGPGSDTYRVYLPDGVNPDKFIGRLTGDTFSALWSRGFLECIEPSSTDKSGDQLYIVRLGKPSLPVFVLED